MKQPESRVVITSSAAARILGDRYRAKYFDPFLAREATANEAAHEVGVPLRNMRYWIRRLLELELIYVSRVSTRKGSPIKHYRSVADELVVSVDASMHDFTLQILEGQYGPFFKTFLRAQARSYFERSELWQIRCFRNARQVAVYDFEPAEASVRETIPPPGQFNHWLWCRLAPEHAESFAQKLKELLQQYEPFVNDGPVSASQLFMIHLGITPLDENDPIF